MPFLHFIYRRRADYVNSHRLQQDHPCVIEMIRQNYLHYPPTEDGYSSLSLANPELVDPSAGQAAVVLPYLHNKVFD